MTDQIIMDFDEHLSREERVLAKLRRRAEDYARQAPEPELAMWPVIVIGVGAGSAMLAAGSAFASPTEGPGAIELQKESLEAVEAARLHLDEIRTRKPTDG